MGFSDKHFRGRRKANSHGASGEAVPIPVHTRLIVAFFESKQAFEAMAARLPDPEEIGQLRIQPSIMKDTGRVGVEISCSLDREKAKRLVAFLQQQGGEIQMIGG